jgi:hypothetical protein
MRTEEERMNYLDRQADEFYDAVQDASWYEYIAERDDEDMKDYYASLND